MKKIMFSDKYELTKAVLEGRKTQTRRIVPTGLYNQTDWKAVEEGDFRSVVDGEDYYHDIRDCGNYRIGEVVAIAQAYKDCKRFVCLQESAGFNNKMFVKAELMPHHIRITDVRVERLQDISEEDCIAEGIIHVAANYDVTHPCETYLFVDGEDYSSTYYEAREAYSALIDKISGKGTWNANPFVFVYEFELVD